MQTYTVTEEWPTPNGLGPRPEQVDIANTE